MSALKSVGQEHDVVVLHLQDPAERGIPGTGLFRGQEAETGRAFVAHGKKGWDISNDAKHELTRYRVDYLLLRTDENVLAKLRVFMRMRGRRSDGGR